MHVISADTTVADSIRYTQYRFRYDTDPIIVRSLVFVLFTDVCIVYENDDDDDDDDDGEVSGNVCVELTAFTKKLWSAIHYTVLLTAE